MNGRYYSNPAFNGKKGPECAYYCQNVLRQDILQRGGPRRHGGLPVEKHNPWWAVADKLREEAIEITKRWEENEPDWMAVHQSHISINMARQHARMRTKNRRSRSALTLDELNHRLNRLVRFYWRFFWSMGHISLQRFASKVRARWDRMGDHGWDYQMYERLVLLLNGYEPKR